VKEEEGAEEEGYVIGMQYPGLRRVACHRLHRRRRRRRHGSWIGDHH
jgi:hypothetical protein